MDKAELIQDFFNNMNIMKGRWVKHHSESQFQGMPTHTQIGIMMAVCKKNKSIKELAELFGISSSAITQVVDTLVKDGLLKRKEDISDRRKLSVSLTAKGKKVLDQVKKARVDGLSNILSILNEEELLALSNIQKKIIAHLPTYEHTTAKKSHS